MRITKNREPAYALGSIENYKYYRTKLEKEKARLVLDMTSYREIYNRIIEKISDEIINGNIVNFGDKLGHLRVKKYKQLYLEGNLKIDWANTRLWGKRMEYLNLHTNGYYYGFYWSKYHATQLKDKGLYSFIASGKLKQRLVAVLFDPNRTIDYHQ